MPSASCSGHVYLVGAGPGDPDLLTVKAAKLLSQAEIVVYDRLVSRDILALVQPEAQMIDVGKSPDHHPVPQVNINALLISLAQRAKTVLRLKGGDPYLFGRGSEEAAELRAAGLRFTVIPGITAAQGIAARTGVPLTHRGIATGVRYVTGHCRAGHDLDLDWSGLAHEETTLVIYMGRANAGQIAARLMAEGLPADHPAMLVADGTRPTETRRYTTLSGLHHAANSMPPRRPVLLIIGRVVDLAEDLLAALDRPALDRVQIG